LLEWAFAGDSRGVKEWLERGADPNARLGHPTYLRRFSWPTPLHGAAWSGSVMSVKLLLEAGAKPDAIDGDGGTPLHVAASSPLNDDVIRLLLDLGLDPNAQDFAGETPLHEAVRSGDPGNVEILLEAGADPHFRRPGTPSPLRLAARHYPWVLGAFAKHGVKVEPAPGPEAPAPERSASPLLDAVDNQDYVLLARLLEEGYDPNAPAGPGDEKHREGTTPLMRAAALGHPEAMAILLRAGASPRVAYPDGTTPLHLVDIRLSVCPTPVRAMIKMGADVNARNKFLQTPAFSPSLQYYPWGLAALLENGADPNARDIGGNTPIHVAVLGFIDYEDDPERVKFELELASDPLDKYRAVFIDKEKRVLMVTPLPSRRYNNVPFDIVELLVRYGADINARNALGETPLILVARSGRREDFEGLVELGADPNAKDESGMTVREILEEAERRHSRRRCRAYY